VQTCLNPSWGCWKGRPLSTSDRSLQLGRSTNRIISL
jgi:hypothetical protein